MKLDVTLGLLHIFLHFLDLWKEGIRNVAEPRENELLDSSDDVEEREKNMVKNVRFWAHLVIDSTAPGPNRSRMNTAINISLRRIEENTLGEIYPFHVELDPFRIKFDTLPDYPNTFEISANS